jgi:YaiO family outer membrane protein
MRRAILALVLVLTAVSSLRAQEPDAAARRAVADKDFVRARALYQGLTRSYPNDLDYANWVARLSGWMGDYATATSTYDRVLARDPRNVDALVGKAYIRMWQHKFPEAKSLLDRARALMPEAPDVKQALAAYQRYRAGPDPRIAEAREAIVNNNLPRALELYQQLAREHRGDLDNQIECARIMGWMSEYRSAIEAYDAILRKAPDNVEAVAGKAYVLMWSGDYPAARELLERAYSKHPDSVEINLALGRYYHYEDYDELAAPYINRVLAKDPADPEALAVKSSLVPYHPWVIRTGYEHDWFNFFTPGNIGTVEAGHSAHGLELYLNWQYYDRFGKDEQRFGASIVDRINSDTWVRGRFLYAPGGATVLPREDFGAGLSRRLGYGFVPGFDYTYLHFSVANVYMLMPSMEYYFRRYPIWLRFVFFQTVTSFTASGGGNTSTQSYLFQYSEALTEWLTGHVGYAYGAESFSSFTSDRLGTFVGNTVFGSVDFALSPQYSISFFGNRQARSNGQRLASIGVQVMIRQ